MSNIEGADSVRMTSDSPQHLDPSLGAEPQEKTSEDQGISAALLGVKQELKEMLLEVFDGAFAPSCGEEKACSAESFDFSSSTDMRASAADIHPIKAQLQLLMGRADDLQNQLAHAQDQLEREHLSTLVPTFLSSSQPLFTYLESRARSRLSQQPAGPLPSISSSTLLELSQQLCERLEQLVLNYAQQGVLSVDESQSDSLSHFYIGQCVIDGLKVSVFRYHSATPFLSGGGAQPGLYKRMRWNVERLSDDRLHPHQQQQQQEEQEERQLDTGGDTEYFFMCYEDIPEGVSREEGAGLAPGDLATGTWSIGRWVQTVPDPDIEDINDWVLCEVPRARYLKLVSLGSKEPSVCHATDCLLGVLLPQQTGGKDDVPFSE